jgi:predicted CXXCH cytochrome family protein
VPIAGADPAAPSAAVAHDTKALVSLTYVGSSACAECHATQFAAWKTSDHFHAMAEPSESTVRGDFNDARFTYNKVTSTFFRKDGRYWVRTDGPDGKLADFPIKYTFGYTPLQQYLIELPGGRLQALSISWDARPREEGGQRWFHQYPGQAIAAGDPLHWTGRDQNWNFQCAACHSTHLEKNYDRATHRFATTWSEINVGCEACHGPASAHLAWSQKKTVDDPALAANKGFVARLTGNGQWRFEGDHPIARLTGPAPQRTPMEACWSCHARRSQTAEPLGHGRPFLDAHRPALLESRLYYVDGQQRDEVYTWGSFAQSRMYRAGVTCSNCHDAHSGRLKAAGNALCLQCHQPAAFDVPKHTHHAEGTTGAQCVNCHMPATNYMVVDARRDHSFSVPRPDLSIQFGTPNACSSCHRDKDAQWAAQSIAAWFGPGRRQDALMAAAFDAAARREAAAEAALNALIDAPMTAPVQRATAISLLPAQMPRSAAAIARGVEDADPVVRAAALERLDVLPPAQRIALAAPRLNDTSRLVRIAAARALADAPQAQLPPGTQAALTKSLQEAIDAELAQAERPEALMNLATLYQRMGRTAEAEAILKEALAIDPQSAFIRVNLADLYRATGRDKEAEPVLREAIKLAPQSADVQHAYGLLLVREKRMKEALLVLAASAKLAPDNPRYAYVYAVALNSSGESSRAIAVLEAAHLRAPGDRAVLEALAALERERGNAPAAQAYAAKLQALTASAR